MRDAGLKWIVLLVIGLFTLMIVLGMNDKERIKDGSSLPNGASNIVEVGDGWFEFTYKGKRFLYHNEGIGDHRVESISLLGDVR